MGISNRNVESAYSSDTLVVDKDIPITECATIMAQRQVGILVIVENSKPVGVISERDIVHRLVAKNKNNEGIKVSDIMTNQVLTISSGKSLLEAWEKMNIHHLRHLVVTNDEGELRGVISIRDIVARIALEQQVSGLLESFDIEFALVS